MSPSSTRGLTPSLDFDQPKHYKQVKLKGQIDSNGSLNDPYGHGTFVSGVVAGYSANGHFVGIAPNADVNAVNISRPDGVRTSDVMAALLWVLANHKGENIDVVNLSLTETTTSSYLSSPLDAVVEKLWSAGVVVVVSAGNKGPGTTSYAPANDPFVISVGATDTTVPRPDDGRVVLVERHDAGRRHEARDHGPGPAHRLARCPPARRSTARLPPRRASSPATCG